MAKLQLSEETAEASRAKCSSLEKSKQALQMEIEDMVVELERSSAAALALEKRQRSFDKVSRQHRRKAAFAPNATRFRAKSMGKTQIDASSRFLASSIDTLSRDN